MISFTGLPTMQEVRGYLKVAIVKTRPAASTSLIEVANLLFPARLHLYIQARRDPVHVEQDR